jgi:eukaryotic-like serine/threonine-protein kinase
VNAPAKRIGKYEVIDLLGRGGMGLVYRAFDRQLNREVAIKTLTEGFSGDQEMLQRFYREAAKTGALKHPNIVTVYDLGEQDGFPYIVMEYLSGHPLDRMIQSGPPQPLAAKLKIIEQVCYALGYAHRNDVIHRDVKPANVIVQSDGVVKLLDFGIARQEKTDGHLTRTGHVIGTAQYMAPERLKNAAFDGRSDIFSVGIMMFQLLTGELPFGGDYNVVQRILSEKHPSLGQFLSKYPAALDAILDRALAKNASDRYSTADEMAWEIASVGQELRNEQIAEKMQKAERLVQAEEFNTAREVLLDVLKLHNQHTAARQMMARVQQNLNAQQRAEQLRQLRAHAEEALFGKRYTDAIHLLEEACGLDPSNSELAELLESTRHKKRRREIIDGYLREADAARDMEDFESARALIAKAAEVDRDDTRVRAAQIALPRQIKEAAGRAKTKKLLESARKEINARQFTAAMETLAEVERLDPSNPELIKLQAAARSTRDQEQRRRIVDQMESEVSLASTPEEITQASQLVEQALQKFPAEPSLIKLKGDLARKIRDEEIRRRVDEVALRCHDLIETSPDAALKLVHQVLYDAPANERLLALQSAIVSHISEHTQEQNRAQYLTQAHEALSNCKYIEALRLLEACQKEGDSSPEIAELIDFVHQSLQKNVDSILQAVESLRNREQYADAIKFLEAQSPAILKTGPVQQALTSLRQSSESELAALQAVGSAYAALDRLDMNSGTLGNSADSSLLTRIVPIFASRQKSVADRQLSSAIEQARIAIEAGDKKQAVKLLDAVVPFTEHSSSGLQDEWQALNRKAKGNVFRKPG